MSPPFTSPNINFTPTLLLRSLKVQRKNVVQFVRKGVICFDDKEKVTFQKTMYFFYLFIAEIVTFSVLEGQNIIRKYF